MIRIKNISKSFGKQQVLNNINLELEGGNVYGIVGENGSGKTTLFRCIADLESCEGEIETKYKKLKNHIGFLQTNPVFMSKITGWEYLKLLCTARDIKEDNFDKQNIFELPLNQYAETYSTGMKKKLALMAILLQKNDVFILDEPFNGVDIHSNIIISEIIRELRRANKTVLLSSHIFTTLSDNCDKIFLLKGGQIIKSAEQNDFQSLEKEMKTFIVGDTIKKLKIE